MNAPQRGDIWWAEMPDKRRPVLVLTRNAVIPVLRTVLVAPVTRRIRSIPTEVVLGPDDGMRTESAVALDSVTIADKAFLVERLTTLSAIRMAEVCRALATAVDC